MSICVKINSDCSPSSLRNCCNSRREDTLQKAEIIWQCHQSCTGSHCKHLLQSQNERFGTKRATEAARTRHAERAVERQPCKPEYGSQSVELESKVPYSGPRHHGTMVRRSCASKPEPRRKLSRVLVKISRKTIGDQELGQLRYYPRGPQCQPSRERSPAEDSSTTTRTLVPAIWRAVNRRRQRRGNAREKKLYFDNKTFNFFQK